MNPPIRLRRALLLCGTALMAPGAALGQGLAPNARPAGGQVVAGSASIQQNPTLTQVNQASNRAIIDWRSFDVGTQHSVQFQQPSATAMALNRVTGPDPSVIAGRITANGQIALVNQSGVVFTQGAQVTARSVIVSTADIGNAAFMAGSARLPFDRPGRPGARIVNHGTITVRDSGLAALVAPQVANHGTINARLSRVALAGAETVAVDLYGDGLLSLAVTGPVRTTPNGQTALVTNTGVILAEGGSIRLTAAAADGIVQDLVRAGGRISANTDPTTGRTGRVLIAGTGGTVRVEGEVTASGLAANTRGGSVTVQGDRVQVAGTARIDASGATGGGRIALGSTRPNTPRARLAQTTAVEAGAVVRADATVRGNGGRVLVNSSRQTTMAGTISARGGPQGGNGGNIEVSGRQGFAVTGNLDAGAPRGTPGNVLLDPTNLAVVNPGDTPPGYDAYVSNATVNGTGGNLTLQADQNLSVLAGITKPTGGLTLQAGAVLTIGAPVTLGAGDLVLTGGSLALNDVITVPAGNTLALQALGTGGILQGPAGSISTGTLTVQSGGDVTLTAATNVVQTIGASNVTGDFNLVNSANGAINLQGDIQVSGLFTLNVTSFFPFVNQPVGSRLLVNRLALTVLGNANLTGDNQIGDVTNFRAEVGSIRNATSLLVSGPATFNNTTAQIDVVGGNLTIDGTVTGRSGALLRASGNIQLGATGSVVVGDQPFFGIQMTAGYDFTNNRADPTAAGGMTLAGVINANNSPTNTSDILLAAGTGGIVQTGGQLLGNTLTVRSGGNALLDRGGSQAGALNSVVTVGGTAVGDFVYDNGNSGLLVASPSRIETNGIVAANIGLRTTSTVFLQAPLVATGTVSLRVGGLGLGGQTVTGSTAEIAPATPVAAGLPLNTEGDPPFQLSSTDLALLNVGTLRFGATTFRGVTTTTATSVQVVAPLAWPGTLDLRSLGDITQAAGADLTVGTLAGIAGGVATLTNPGNRVNVLADFSATGGLALTDAVSLAIAGTVQSPQTVRLNVTGDVQETGAGRIAAGLLNLDATGAVVLAGNNAVVQLGNSSAGTSFALSDDVAALSVPTGNTVNAGGGLNLSNTGNLTVDGTVTGTVSNLAVNGTLTINGFSAIARTGTLSLSGNRVVTTGLIAGATGIQLSANTAQLGGLATVGSGILRIAAPAIVFTGLNAATAPVRLQLGTAGTAVGALDALALNVFGGAGTNLTGTIAGVPGGPAAAIGQRSTATGTPLPDPPQPTAFLFNACPIGVAVCAPPVIPPEPPVVPPVTPPVIPPVVPPVEPEPPFELPPPIVTLANNPQAIVSVLNPGPVVVGFAGLRPPLPEVSFNSTRDSSEESELAPPNVRRDDY